MQYAARENDGIYVLKQQHTGEKQKREKQNIKTKPLHGTAENSPSNFQQ